MFLPRRNPRSLLEVDSFWRGSPVALNRLVVVLSYHGHHVGASLKRFLEHCSHVQVLWGLENVGQEVVSAFANAAWNCELFGLSNDKFEDVLKLIQLQGVCEDLSVENLWHICQENLLIAHQSLVKSLAKDGIFGVVFPNDVFRNAINQLISQHNPSVLILDSFVVVRVEALWKLQITECLVVPQHVQNREIHHEFLPT